jgi:NTE family protein
MMECINCILFLVTFMQRRSFLGLMAVAPTLLTTVSASHAAPQKPVKVKPDGRRVGIAFGGGSIHGMAHLGVLKALAEKSVKFDFIAGTSAGAIIGVLAAARLPYGRIERIARDIEWPGLMNLSWSGTGLMKHTKLISLIDAALSGRKIEQLSVPFGAIATDVATGERVIIRNGPAGLAVGASCSVPVMFEPVRIDGRDLVDGGLTEPVPVIAVREMGADIVIGVDVAFRPDEEAIHGMPGVAFQTMHIMANALINEQIGRADVAIRMNLHKLVGMEASHEKLVAAGYAAAMQAWPRLRPFLVR